MVFKSLIAVKVWYYFVNIFNICPTVILNFTCINWWQGCTNIKLTLYDIMMAFFKIRNIRSIFCDHTLVVWKSKIHALEGVNIEWAYQWIVHILLQAWVLTPVIRQCMEKIRGITDKSCFKTDAVVLREVKILWVFDVLKLKTIH